VKEVYADTAFFIALVSEADTLHDLASLLAEQFEADGTTMLVTSDAVLLEFLSGMSKFGPDARGMAVAMVRTLLEDPTSLVVPQTRDLLRRAVDLYADRLDKQWSGVDCLSIVVMGDRGIDEVLTHDHHFTQAGSRILM
jgi:uncharacterized protein